MQQTRAVELGTGLFVFLGIGALFFLTTQTTNLEYTGDEGYHLTARFENIGSLKVRAPVSMAGVTIGRVESIKFDPQELNAVVTLRLDGRYKTIPDDSDAVIYTSGLLGTQYVGLGPGGSDTFFADGDEIMLTQSAIILEELVGKYLIRSGSQE